MPLNFEVRVFHPLKPSLSSGKTKENLLSFIDSTEHSKNLPAL